MKVDGPPADMPTQSARARLPEAESAATPPVERQLQTGQDAVLGRAVRRVQRREEDGGISLDPETAFDHSGAVTHGVNSPPAYDMT